MDAILDPAAPLDPPTLDVGAPLLPHVRVVRHLARGRDADVYDAWCERRQCACIAKVVRPDRADAADVVDRLGAEAALLGRLTHPNIVRVYEHGQGDGGSSVTIMERVDGMSLHTLSHGVGRMIPWPDLVTWTLQLASALGYLHAEGSLHLDVKPGNLLVTGGGIVLIDFHLARPPGPVPAGLGTRRYLSPEQARGDSVTSAADVWGLGVTMWEAAAGRSAFLADVAASDGAAPPPAAGVSPPGVPDEWPQLLGRAAPIRSHRQLPAALAEVIDACLDPSPAARPAIGQVVSHLYA